MAGNPAILTFPSYFAPKSVTITIDRPFYTGPKPLSGREQIVSSFSGGWQFKFNDIALKEYLVRDYLSYMSYLSTNSPLIYVCPVFGQSRLGKRNANAFNITYTLDSNVVQNATSIVVSRNQSPVLGYGELFEINGRLHRVFGLSLNTPTTNKDTISFWPPLRANYTAGTQLEILLPICLMTVVPNTEAYSTTQGLGGFAMQSIQFAEANWPNSVLYP